MRSGGDDRPAPDALPPDSIIFAASLAGAVLPVWLFEASPLRARLEGLRRSDSQVLGGVAAMFARLSAFMASEVWQRRSEAVLSAEAEAVALRDLLRIADAVGPPADARHAAARTCAQW